MLFFPGAGEIIRAQKALEELGVNAVVHVLYGDLPLNRQQEALLPDRLGRRKIVLATSIAETSLTITGVKIVVDSGWSRVPRFDPKSGLTRLETVKVTRDTADQRAGRAGRLSAGVAYRLWAEGTHPHLVPTRTPEILEADLAPMLLELAQWGTQDVFSMTWITPPPLGAVSQARELLEQLDALENGQITSRGRDMVRLPIHPRLAHMLLEASRWGMSALALACDVAAILDEKDPLPKEAGADLSLRVEVLRKWRENTRVNADEGGLHRIERVAASWRSLFKVQVNNRIVSEHEVGQMIALAYPERIARQTEKNGERYKLANGRVVRLPSTDFLARYSWLAVAHLDAGTNEGKIFLAAPLDEKDLEQLAVPHESVYWDYSREMLVGVMERRIGNVVLGSKPLGAIPVARRMAVLCNLIREEGLKRIGWGEKEEQWQARVMSLKRWRSDEDWPDVTEATLLQNLETWLGPYLENVSKKGDLERLDLGSILAGLIPWSLLPKLDQLAPLHFEVPTGSKISVRYFQEEKPPVIEVRLQEMFGLSDTPTINQGRTKILMHLLSPGYKPVQVTQDLKSFWEGTYHEVRKELRMRYPKHSWPEDPWSAQPVRGVKKRNT